jgi:ABC-type sugar transport system, permease component
MVGIKETKSDHVFNVVNYIILGIILLICIYPIWYVFIASISNPFYVNSGQVILLPKGITWLGYTSVFQEPLVLIGYRNSFFYTVFGTLLALAVTLPAAYALSRKDFVGRKPITIIFTITMFFSGGLIPSYLVIQSLHLINSPLCLIILGAVSAYNIILCRSYFESNISSEIQDAAEIDGCSNFKLFTRIVIPLSKPIIAVMVLFIAVSKWNSYFTALIYITKDELKPLQLVLYNILVASQDMTQMMNTGTVDASDAQKVYNTEQLIRYSLIITASVPVMCLYPLVQKYFVKGIMLGSVKG